MGPELVVYVPTEGSPLGLAIADGSAIVGESPGEDERILVYYEGNIHGASNMRTFRDRARHAAGRLRARYPTVAVASVEAGELRAVGRFVEEDTPRIVLSGEAPGAREASARWLSVTPEALDAELASSGDDPWRRPGA